MATFRFRGKSWLAEHRTRGRTFSRFTVVPCHQDRLKELESLYILKIKPPGNVNGMGRLVVSKKRGALPQNYATQTE